jgi:RNA polymerase sigma factor (sigma-70 family)
MPGMAGRRHGGDVTHTIATRDDELVARCLNGDERAWSELVDRYQRLVYSVALKSGLNGDDADDVFQIVFTTVYRRLGGLRDHGRLAPWLITTTQREAWRVSRSHNRTSELDENVADVRQQMAEDAEHADRDQRVREAMSELDERCRSLLTALFLDTKAANYGEIADQLGMAVGSIGPTRARCFKKLETLLRAAGFTE